MSDYLQSFTLPEIEAVNAVAVAAQLSGWLIDRGIGREGPTDARPGDTGLLPGPRAEEVLVSQEFDWRSIGFTEIHVCPTREVSAAVQGGMGPVFCPACEGPLGDDDDVPDAFMRAAEKWAGGEEGILACPACKSTAPITKWRTEPFWAFGHVTITFWNWPLIGDAFARDVEAVTGQSVKIVRGKM